MEVLKENIDAGKIKNVCETFTDGWQPSNAQKNMEQCLTSVSNKVDAVVSENDGMAGGVVAALEAQGLAGTVPVTGQDGDHAALNRVALGTQLVSVWKDSRVLGKAAAEAGQQIAEGTNPADLPGVTKFSGGHKGVEVNAILIPPNPITKANLNDVIDGGWVPRKRSAPASPPDRSRPATDRLVKPCGLNMMTAPPRKGWRGFFFSSLIGRDARQANSATGGGRRMNRPWQICGRARLARDPGLSEEVPVRGNSSGRPKSTRASSAWSGRCWSSGSASISTAASSDPAKACSAALFSRRATCGSCWSRPHRSRS